MISKSSFKKFMLLWVGEFVSSVGGGLTSFGLGVYIFHQTGSAASMALVTLLAFLPSLLLSAPAGVLADRYDRRLMMMLGDSLSAIGIIYILICMMNGGASLLQICIGVTVSSVFSCLMDPAYKATVTDLLTKEEYSKASGLVSMAGSARYLLSPLLAGVLLGHFDIKLLLIIDICTFFLTVFTTGVVRKGLPVKKAEKKESFISSYKTGWKAITQNKGVLILVIVSSIMTCFLGAFQILSEPLVLSFESSTTLGIVESVCASGMLVTSLILGIRGIKKGYVKILSLSLAAAGIAMIFFGVQENLIVIGIAGFFFFSMLPFANNCLDFLVRTNIADELQGRIWGLISFMSQIGYVIAYGLAGILADGIGNSLEIGVGRGAAIVIMTAGVLLTITALTLTPIRAVRKLEKAVND